MVLPTSVCRKLTPECDATTAVLDDAYIIWPKNVEAERFGQYRFSCSKLAMDG